MTFRMIQADVFDGLRSLPDASVHCVVTSPPYWALRSYLPKDHPLKAHELGSEKTPDEYIARQVDVFREVRRLLRPDGVLWLNMGDVHATGAGRVGQHPGGGKQGERARRIQDHTPLNRLPIAGLKSKDLVGTPWMLAFALRADGWYLRMDCVWHKRTPVPESVKDRPTKAHEYVFLLSKSEKYYYDWVAVVEPASSNTHPRRTVGANSRLSVDRDPRHTPYERRQRNLNDGIPLVRNLRSVWSIASERAAVKHYATFPRALARPCVLAGTSEKGCCAICQAPYRRIVKRRFLDDKQGLKAVTKWQSDEALSARNGQPLHSGAAGPGSHHRRYYMPETVGWRRTCRCTLPGDPLPCTVLDPYAGTGTTGIVAAERGCNFIGIELDPRSVQMAYERHHRWLDASAISLPPASSIQVFSRSNDQDVE